jgi:ribosome-binding ATPase YchF (GTP1/OBG family)
MALLESKSLDRAKFKSWTDDDLKELALALIKKSKKMLMAANKADVAPEANIKRLKEVSEENEEPMIPCSAAAELALRIAAKNKIISYLPGTADFDISGNPSEKQKKGLEKIREFSHAHGGTGIQEIINRAVFELLDYVVAYPVEDEHKFSDSTGRILPDALLLKRGSTARDLAFAVHTDIGESYLYAVDARTKLRLSEKHALAGNDIVKVVSTK